MRWRRGFLWPSPAVHSLGISLAWPEPVEFFPIFMIFGSGFSISPLEVNAEGRCSRHPQSRGCPRKRRWKGERSTGIFLLEVLDELCFVSGSCPPQTQPRGAGTSTGTEGSACGLREQHLRNRRDQLLYSREKIVVFLRGGTLQLTPHPYIFFVNVFS